MNGTDICIGKCFKGSACPFIHDPSKVAICKDWLVSGTCRNEPYCDLSHESTPHRVPPCSYYQRGSCTKTSCRYAHVLTNPTAPICAAFAACGYCENGADCPHRHEYECPEYSSTGECHTRGCRLPHVDRAGQLRQRTKATEDSEVTRVAARGSVLDSLEASLADDGSSRKSNSPRREQEFSQQDNFLSLDSDSEEIFEKRFGT